MSIGLIQRCNTILSNNIPSFSDLMSVLIQSSSQIVHPNINIVNTQKKIVNDIKIYYISTYQQP